MGQGHLVLFTRVDSEEIRYAQQAGLHTAALWVGSNTGNKVTTGRCDQGGVVARCGDATIALLNETGLIK
jgi:hypothetical protein